LEKQYKKTNLAKSYKTNDTNKMKIATTTVIQTANETLGTNEKKLYYLIIANDQNEKVVINVGEKTHEKVKELLKNEPNAINAITEPAGGIKEKGGKK